MFEIHLGIPRFMILASCHGISDIIAYCHRYVTVLVTKMSSTGMPSRLRIAR